MNWIERMYELKGKDLYSQNGEGIYLEYVVNQIENKVGYKLKLDIVDIGGGDGFYLSNSRHIKNIGGTAYVYDLENDNKVNLDNVLGLVCFEPLILSVDTDGNDYWIINTILEHHRPYIIICEFNPAFTDSRTIKYNPNHEWAGDDYYGFSFEAGKNLAEKHDYEIIFNVANMNLIMVRKDLINVPVPLVTYKQDNFFTPSNRTDWIWV